MNKIFLRAKLILPALAASILLSGCALTDLLGGSSSIWNQDVKELNQKINCPAGGVQTPSAGAYATPTASWNQNDIIEVAFDSNGNPQPNTTNTFKYFRIDQGAKVPAYKADFGIWTYVDKMWNGYIPIDQTKRANLAQDTMFVPLVTPTRKLMTNIITPSSQNASVARWPRASQSEIYTMNKSFYFDANLSALDYYKPLKWPNVPAIIFILYLPDKKYAQLTHAERVAQIPDYQTSNALRFDVYYSVAQYNLHFNQKTCAASQHPLKLTPPQQFAYCHANQPAAGPVSKNTPSASPGVVETAFNTISKLSRCLINTEVAHAADTSAAQVKPAPQKGISWWSRAISKIKSWLGVSADTVSDTGYLSSYSGEQEAIWRSWASANTQTVRTYWDNLSDITKKQFIDWTYKTKANSVPESWNAGVRFDTRLYDGTWLAEWIFTPSGQATATNSLSTTLRDSYISSWSTLLSDKTIKSITPSDIGNFKKEVTSTANGASTALDFTDEQKAAWNNLLSSENNLTLNTDKNTIPVAEGLPEPVGEQKSADSQAPQTSQPGQNLNQPKLHKEEVAKCQEKCDLGPLDKEHPEKWNPYWQISDSNDLTATGQLCSPPATLGPKKAVPTDGCGDDIKNKLCYATTPDCSLGTLRCSVPGDARNATPAFSCMGDYSGQAHECGTDRTQKWCPNEKQLAPFNINDIVATLTVFDKPAFRPFVKQDIVQSWVSDLLNWDFIGFLTNDANRDKDTQRGSPSAAWDPLAKIVSSAIQAISSAWKPQLQSAPWSKELGLSIKPGTKYYSVSALEANLDPNNRGGCYNDSTFYNSKGNQDWKGIYKCAFTHAEYEVTFGDDMNSFGGSGRANSGSKISDITHGLFQTLDQFDPSKLAKQLGQIGEWAKQMGSSLQDTTNALQNASQQAQSNANSSPYNQPNPGSEGAHPYPNTPSISEKDTNICYYTPE